MEALRDADLTRQEAVDARLELKFHKEKTRLLTRLALTRPIDLVVAAVLVDMLVKGVAVGQLALVRSQRGVQRPLTRLAGLKVTHYPILQLPRVLIIGMGRVSFGGS
jgi:hypothetical protein